MSRHAACIALVVCLASSSCVRAGDPDRTPDVAGPTSHADESSSPMAAFARLAPASWRTTLGSGSSFVDVWEWGPGRHSVRAGALEVFYWHPARREVRILTLHPDIPAVGRGVGEGSIAFDGMEAQGRIALDQPRGRRFLGVQWRFEGTDSYRDTLLESASSDGPYGTLAEWVRVRVPDDPTAPPRDFGDEPAPSASRRAFEPYLDAMWSADTDPARIDATFTWVPDFVHARVEATSAGGTREHVLDAYVFEDVRTSALRVLALSNRGDVDEGVVAQLEGGVLEFETTSHSAAGEARRVARLEIEDGPVARLRAWRVDRGEREQLLDSRLTAHSASSELKPTASRHAAGPEAARSVERVDSHGAGRPVSELGVHLWVVHQDRSGTRWFGSDGEGVYRVDARGIVHFTSADGLTGDRVRQFEEDAAGNVYANTLAGVSRYDGHSFTPLIVARHLTSASDWKLAPDDLWFRAHGADERGVYRYDGQELVHLRFPRHEREAEFEAFFPASPYSPFGVYTIARDSRGSIWFGTAILGACRFDGTTFTWLSTPELTEFHHGPSIGMRGIVEDRDGTFWLTNTLHRYEVPPAATREPGAPPFTRRPGIPGTTNESPHSHMNGGLRSRAGELWMVTYGAGVFRFDGERVKHYPVREDGKTVLLVSIAEDRDGTLWLGTQEAGAYRFDGEQFVRFRP